MIKDSFLTKITEIIVEKTVNQKIPTVIFLSDIDKGSLVKNLIWTIKDGNRDEKDFTSDDWENVAEIMRTLAEIPLLLKETFDIKEIKTETENFITGMEGKKGLVIINSKENVTDKDFTTDENISVIVI